MGVLFLFYTLSGYSLSAFLLFFIILPEICMRKPSFINLQFFRNRTPPPAFATHHTTEALLPSALHPSVMQVNVRRSAETVHCHAPPAGSTCGSSSVHFPSTLFLFWSVSFVSLRCISLSMSLDILSSVMTA